MTQEIKLKLEQATDALFEHKGYSFTPCDYAMRKGFLKGAQTILENPAEWGLCSLEIHKQAVKTFDKITMDAITAEREIVDERNRLQSQLAKYREVLEAIKSECDPNNPTHEKIWRIAFNATKEALK